MALYSSKNSSYYLESLVHDHHSQYRQLWPDDTLTPKMHILLHYGEAMRRNGPLRYLWCFRFEAKHQIAKRVGDLTNNYRNPPLTVANQYQISNFAIWSLEDISQETCLGLTLEGGSVAWVRYKGVQYQPGAVIHYGNREGTPLLAVINHITYYDNSYQFHGSRLDVALYDTHLMAYVVATTNEAVCILPNSLITPHPSFVTQTPDDTLVVIPKYKIC